MKKLKTFLMIMCALAVSPLLSADPVQHVLQALENTKNLEIAPAFTGNALYTISTATIYEASLGFSISNTYGDISTSKYVLIDKDTLTFFDTEYQLFSSAEFLASITSNFHLKSIEDGLLFQELLYAIDGNYFNEGFFIEENSWIFIRDEFFGDIEAWIVETDENGTISTISYVSDADIIMADECYHNPDNDFIYEEVKFRPVPDEKIQLIQENIQKDFVYELTASPITSRWLKQLSTAKWYNCTLSVYEEYEDMSFSSLYEIIALEIDDDISFFEDSNELISSPEFLKSIKDDFFLVDEISQEDFELALDQISDFDRKEKQRFERNGEWVFIRQESFDEGRGFIVRTDAKGIITHIEYSYNIPLEDAEVPFEEWFDESQVSWTFTLIEPLNTEIHISQPEYLPVTIEFNDWAANKVGAWIGTFQDGNIVGVYAGTEISSPFYDFIPAEILNEGETIISYKLLRPGNDYDNPISSIDISIWLGDY